MQTPQLYSPSLPTSFIVVLLTALTVQGTLIPEDTILEVDRAVRNDWIGSKFCRDATDEEIAEHRAHGGEALADQLQEEYDSLSASIVALQDRKTELTGDLKALEDDLEALGKQRDDLQAEVGDLVAKQKTLAEEVAALEKAKAKASK